MRRSAFEECDMFSLLGSVYFLVKAVLHASSLVKTDNVRLHTHTHTQEWLHAFLLPAADFVQAVCLSVLSVCLFVCQHFKYTHI